MEKAIAREEKQKCREEETQKTVKPRFPVERADDEKEYEAPLNRSHEVESRKMRESHRERVIAKNQHANSTQNRNLTC